MAQAQVQVQHEQVMPNFGIESKNANETAQLLAQLESDETAMFLHTLNYHQNVVGPRAHMLCELWRQQSKEIGLLEEKIAFHLRGLGFKVPILTEKMRMTRVDNPREGVWPDENGMITVLLTNHENIIRHICRDRQRVSDMKVKAIEDLLLEVERCHMKWAWELRIHLERAPSGGRQ